MPTPKQAAASLRDKLKLMLNVGNEIKKDVVVAIATDLYQVTPVDTSQALSNWQASPDSPAVAKIAPYVAGKGGATQGASAALALADTKKAVAQAKPGKALYLSNLLPYIRRLNDGSSSQAPAGFVQRAVLIGRIIARKRRGGGV
jgi:hypothetical protein